ncbi:MAG: hypothetical protein COV34_01005 [Candidatus Zambryskibacteria bacterium CG10_big_fil_rev_8_21_14_0_10_42_12]|uniref:Methyltransferase FkbM domain-containing protein n=1 Tax=Candidatus Zambryskibacteria bacterium CG10_big_fil_rev_8_21_14_0_10_42_12 TaxID=1975115 RepID=A0A2H0QV65_9BACT|nr:MAG: hypothetical protein COV34_01005 [Candidatus Zambryskibacteria bacterium CG10_big_fil_rev_8_21_14_0_10_42_12]
MNPLRKIVQKFGLDIHRYRHVPQKLNWLTKFDIKTIIDVGANTGQFAHEIRSFFKEAHIYSFEPLAECFNELKKREEQDSKFTAYHMALGDSNKKDVIHKSSYTLSSSMLSMSEKHKTSFPHTKDSTPEEITVTRMDDICKDIELVKRVLIKIDTQGFEDKVIAGGINTISQAKALIVENSFVPLYEGQKLFPDIYESLYKIGFTYRGALHQKVAKDGEILFEDSIFVKDN